MLTPFAIALFVGASSVLGQGLTCGLLQQLMIKNGEFAPGDAADAVKPLNFQNRVLLQRPPGKQQFREKSPKYMFLVKRFGKNLPEVVVDGTSYKLYSYSAMPLPKPTEGMASLLLQFHSSIHRNGSVTIIVPILVFEKWVPNLNEDLNSDLHELGRLSQFEVDEIDTSIGFIEPLLKDAIRLRIKTRKIFMVDCEKIAADEVINYLK